MPWLRTGGPIPPADWSQGRDTPRASGRPSPHSKGGLQVTAHPVERAPRSLAAAPLGCHVAPPHPSRWPPLPGTEMLTKEVHRLPLERRRLPLHPALSRARFPLAFRADPAPEPLTEMPRDERDDGGGGRSVRAEAAGWPTWTRGRKQPLPTPVSVQGEKRGRGQRDYTAGACQSPPPAGTH